MEHSHSAIVQADDYYPFGMTFNGYKRENSKKNRFLYNEGSELQDDLGLNVFQTQFRMLDPAIGRWWQIDPKASTQESPYVSMGNNPMLFNDPLGDTLRYGHITINNFWTDTYMGRDLTEAGKNLSRVKDNIKNIITGEIGIVIYGTGEFKGKLEMGSDRDVKSIGVLDLGNPENILSTLDIARPGSSDKDVLGKLIERFGRNHPLLDARTSEGYRVFESSEKYMDKDGNTVLYSPFEARENGKAPTYIQLETYRNDQKEITGYGYKILLEDELKQK